MPFNIFGKKSPARIKDQRIEEQARYEAHQKGRIIGIKRRAFKEGLESTKPLGARIGSGFAKFQGAIAPLEDAFSLDFGSQPRRSQPTKHKKSKAKTKSQTEEVI